MSDSVSGKAERGACADDQWEFFLEDFQKLLGETSAVILNRSSDDFGVFWETFLYRAKTLSPSVKRDEFEEVVNDLSPHLISGLPEEVRGRWETMHQHYLALGGTSEGMLKSLPEGLADAWRKLESRYQPLIRSQLVQFCNTHHDNKIPYELEDVTQAILARLVEVLRREPFVRERHGSFRVWLQSLALNVIREYDRKNRKELIPLISDFTAWTSSLDDINSLIVQEWHDACLTSILESIEEHCRSHQRAFANSTALRDFEIFKAHTWLKWRGEKVSPAEIAERFGVSLSVVYSNEGKMRSLCRRLLEAQGWDNDL